MPTPARSRAAPLAVALCLLGAGIVAVWQMKRADVVSTERDQLLRIQIRQVSASVAAALRAADRSANATSGFLKRTLQAPETLAAPASARARLETMVRPGAPVLHIRAKHADKTTIDVKRGGPLMQRLLGRAAAERDRSPAAVAPSTPPAAVEVTGDEKAPASPSTGRLTASFSRPRLVSSGDGDAARLEAHVEGTLHAEDGRTVWRVGFEMDVAGVLAPFTRAPGERFGHLMLLDRTGAALWGPTQQYGDGKTGWIELDADEVRDACRAWQDAGASPNTLVPYTRDGHVFAVGGRGVKAFGDDAPTICVVLPRSGFSALR